MEDSYKENDIVDDWKRLESLQGDNEIVDTTLPQPPHNNWSLVILAILIACVYQYFIEGIK
jgi:hypothetical protein